MQPAPPAGFIFSDGRDADENPFKAQAAHREPAQTDDAARLSRARWCAIFPTLPKYARYRFGDQAAGSVGSPCRQPCNGARSGGRVDRAPRHYAGRRNRGRVTAQPRIAHFAKCANKGESQAPMSLAGFWPIFQLE
jgi:hypothetical protein